MADESSPLDTHWRSFGALREDLRQRRVVLGVDRVFARNWVLRGGEGCPRAAQGAGYLLMALILLSIAGGIYVFVHGAYLLVALLCLMAYLSWRFLVQLAIAAVRSAATKEERRFRTMFDERRLSIFIKATGQYVWNDRPVSS